MKTKRAFILLSAVSLLVQLTVGAAAAATGNGSNPVIESIQVHPTEVIVQVQVPAGLRRVTLECRDHLGRLSWEPRAVMRTDGTGGRLEFRLARSRDLEVMRVRGEATEPLPASFFAGTNTFDGEIITTSDSTAPVFYTTTTWVGPTMRDSPDVQTGTTPPSRAVVESDIWQFRDQTLYFFNQYRGLQIIDVSNPDAAHLRGLLSLPAAGEQMYLVGAQHVVLLARDGCNYSESRVLVVEDNPAGPVITASLPIEGSLQESRMVGTVLYVAAQRIRYVTAADQTTVEWGTALTSIDLANPAAPVARETLWLPGYGNVVAATDVFFFVVTYGNDYYRCTVNIVDITSPDGRMSAYGAVHPTGRVADKFKLNYAGNVLTTVAESNDPATGGRLITRLETFRVPHPMSLGPLGITPLGQLELGGGERLRATRFDGDRVYVVTFFQIDPLWVVSLADATKPAIVGSVEIPGWSTYIEPLGDRLVTVGVETNRVAVSLFDVADPAHPALASRVLLGETHSWSEAVGDEKAFTVLPESGLILVPFNGDVTNRYVSAVQLVDLDRNALTARGQITGTFAFRRATLQGQRILALSGWELQTVDATDRDHPVMSHRLELAWTTDRVLLFGEYLLQIQTGQSWDGFSGPMVRVARAETPDAILGELALGTLPVVGATRQGNRLYVAQGEGSYYPIFYALDGTAAETRPVPPNFVLTVIDLGALPALSVTGKTEAYVASLGWGGEWEPLWPKPDVLVWCGGSPPYPWYAWPITTGPIGIDIVTVMPIGRWYPYPYPYWGGSGGHLLAFDVSDPAAPQLASDVNVSKDNWGNFSRAYAAQGLVYVSHNAYSQIYPVIMPTGTTTGTTTGMGTSTFTTGTIVEPTVCRWMRRDLLEVIDYTDPRDPLVRAPVRLPGSLAGISADGNLLYTTGPRYVAGTLSDPTEYLDALAYDGVTAHLVASLPLPQSWPRALRITGSRIFLGRPGTSATGTTTASALEEWRLALTGKFELLGSVRLAQPARTLADFGRLLAVQESDGSVDLFAIGDDPVLQPIGQSEPAGCWWTTLDHADGDVARGLWAPLGVYGVTRIPTAPR